MRTYKIGTILIVALCLPVTGALANSVPDGIGADGVATLEQLFTALELGRV